MQVQWEQTPVLKLKLEGEYTYIPDYPQSLHPLINDISRIVNEIRKAYDQHNIPQDLSLLTTLEQISEDIEVLKRQDAELPFEVENLSEENSDEGWGKYGALLDASAISRWMHMPELPFEEYFSARVMSVLQSAMEHYQFRGRSFQQIHLAEIHALILNRLGINAIDPKLDQFGFRQLVNDSIVLRLYSSPPAVSYLKEPIRGYRSAAQSGRSIEGFRIAQPGDPAKRVDIFKLIDDSGREQALMELEKIGVTSTDLEEIGDGLSSRFPEHIGRLRYYSDALLSELVLEKL